MFGATTTVSRIDQIEKYIEDPEKVVVFQTAPAVRVALGEEFGMPYGSIVEGKMIAALRAVGGDYVFDTDFGADMTIMEEASELKYRLHSQKNCCPSLRAVARAGLNLPKSIFLNSFHIYRRLVVPSACSVLLLRLILQTAEYRSGQYHQCLCDTVYIKESRNTPPRNEQCWSVYGQT